MVGRFKARRTSDNLDGPNGWGVWDGAANGWRGSDLTEHDAHATADDLDLQYDAHGPRPADTVRRVDPAQPVDRADWQPAGVLEVWIRERGHWYGRVRGPDGQTTWIPATDLHPTR
jgi:hypothetical protein